MIIVIDRIRCYKLGGESNYDDGDQFAADVVVLRLVDTHTHTDKRKKRKKIVSMLCVCVCVLMPSLATVESWKRKADTDDHSNGLCTLSSSFLFSPRDR